MRRLFSIFRRRKDPRGDPEAAAAVASLIDWQFMLHSMEKDEAARAASNDPFVLGYVFGMADMACYQFTDSHSDDVVRASYIGMIFKIVFGSQADLLFELASITQGAPAFEDACAVGASDLEKWLRSKESVPTKLMERLEKSEE